MKIILNQEEQFRKSTRSILLTVSMILLLSAMIIAPVVATENEEIIWTDIENLTEIKFTMIL